MNQVERVIQKCPQCQQVAEGFLIPDGRFVCPTCFPLPVFERWRREWEPLEKQRLKNLAAKEKAELKRQQDEDVLRLKIKRQQQQREKDKAMAHSRHLISIAIKKQRLKEQTAKEKENKIPRHSPCQVCGSTEPLIKKPIGDFWRAFFLMLFLTPIGFIYCFVYDGWAYFCPRCDARVAKMPGWGNLLWMPVTIIVICTIIYWSWVYSEHHKNDKYQEYEQQINQNIRDYNSNVQYANQRNAERQAIINSQIDNQNALIRQQEAEQRDYQRRHQYDEIERQSVLEMQRLNQHR